MKTDDLFADLKPPRKAHKKLMHVCDVDDNRCCDDGSTWSVKLKCHRCGNETDCMEPRTVTQAKRGIPCPVCNAKSDQKSKSPVCEISQTDFESLIYLNLMINTAYLSFQVIKNTG